MMTRRSSFLGVSLLMCGLAVESSAFAADEAPPPLPPPAESGGATATPNASATIDSVHLRNGGLFRGRVTEIVPGDHVTIQIEKGETKKIAWAEIDRVIVASTAMPAPPAAGNGATPASPAYSPAATPPIAAPMVGPRARVHLTSSKTLILYRKPAGTNSWAQACTSPCNEELPIGDTYKVTGNGVAGSKEFHLDASPGGSVDVSVDPPSTGGMVLGGFIGGGGATAAYVGLLMAVIGQGDASRDCYDYYGGSTSGSTTYVDYCGTKKEDGEKLRNAGLITMAVGTGLTVAGILIFLASAKTDIAQNKGGAASARNDHPLMPVPKPADAYLRQPTWKGIGGSSSSQSSTERATQAPPAAFPLVFSGTF